MRFHKGLWILFLSGITVSALPVQAQSPVIFYSDLISGPNSGGENNQGVIVTVSGNNFGSSQGASTVSIGGGAVATYKSWTNTKIQVAIGPNAKTGSIVVTANGKTASCGNPDPGGCTFTVRSGNIYYVSNSGSDKASGAFTAPWQTLYNAVRKVAAGDTIYAENGINISGPDGTGWHSALLLTTENGVISGQVNKPIALVAYPGATVTIGSLNAVSSGGDTTIYGLRAPNGVTDYVISGLTLRGPNVAASIVSSSRWRVVNNDISAKDPGAAIQGALTISEGGTDYVYGNVVHDVGTSSKEGHSVYFSTDNNHDWFGWNQLVNNSTCYELQFHSSPIGSGSGNDMYDIHVHDNYFNGDRCAGLNFATVDPSKGVVEAYNNVFYHVGNGPAPPDGNYNYACIYAAGLLNNGSAPSGTVQIYNNTAYDCGSARNSTYAVAIINDQGSGSNIKYQFANNIFDGTSQESPYIAFGGSAASKYLTCTNNLFYNNGAAPSYCNTKSVAANPNFVSTSTPLFALQAGSPAGGTGSSSLSAKWDFTGMLRPSTPSIGAYDMATTKTPPSSPTNLTGVIK